MDPLEALGDDSPHAEKAGAFGCPVPGATRAVFLAGENHERYPGLAINHRGIVDRDLGFLWVEKIEGQSPLDSREHEIFNSDVGKSSTGHDPVISSTRTVTVEILDRNAMFHEIGAGGRGFLDVPGG